jgi:hypothetical protein
VNPVEQRSVGLVDPVDVVQHRFIHLPIVAATRSGRHPQRPPPDGIMLYVSAFIRPYHERDLAAVYAICVQTADGGADARGSTAAMT